MTLRRSGKIYVLVGALALFALAAFGVAGAAADDGDPVEKPPPYEGLMSFPAIQGPEGPEDYSWTVQLDPEQTLVQVDDRHAEVRWGDEHIAFGIEAGAAHDVEGTAVPTTLAVSEGDVITLTVRHRAGNPAAGGVPFHYPIISGAGWEGGFSTVYVRFLGGETPPAPTCLVPGLAGLSLAGTRAKLTAAGCRLGAVRGKRGRPVKRLRVVKQFRVAGTVLGAGTKVAVKLG